MTAPRFGYHAESFTPSEEPSRGWHALGAVGFALLTIGVVDILLAWIPPRFGNVEWEFGTISATLNNMPVPAMGLALIVAHAIAWARRGELIALAVWASVVVVWLLGAAVLYGLDTPVALRAVQDPAMRRALMSGILKGGVALMVYLAFHIWVVVFVVRSLRQTK